MKKKKSKKSDKIINGIIAFVVIFAVLSLVYSIKTAFFNKETNQEKTLQKHGYKPSLSQFDKELAKKFMDKNNDGKCDSCEMDVEMCIDSGQLQCDMNSKSTIGILDSQHIHADFKVYINNKQMDFSDKAHMERMKAGLDVSSFIHVDSGAPAPEKTGDVLHMHATGVPLWIFFESIGMKFNRDCLTLENGEKYCNDRNNKLKFYISRIQNNEYENYVFNDLDKILISYGDENQQQIQEQLGSITDFAKLH